MTSLGYDYVCLMHRNSKSLEMSKYVSNSPHELWTGCILAYVIFSSGDVLVMWWSQDK